MYLIDSNEVCIDLWKIIAHNGYTNQKKGAIESMSGLTQQIARDLDYEGNREKICEYMADTLIMICSLMLIYGNKFEVSDAVARKLKKQVDTVDKEREGT